MTSATEGAPSSSAMRFTSCTRSRKYSGEHRQNAAPARPKGSELICGCRLRLTAAKHQTGNAKALEAHGRGESSLIAAWTAVRQFRHSTACRAGVEHCGSVRRKSVRQKQESAGLPLTRCEHCTAASKNELETWNWTRLHSSAHRFRRSSSTTRLASKYWCALSWLNSQCGGIACRDDTARLTQNSG